MVRKWRACFVDVLSRGGREETGGIRMFDSQSETRYSIFKLRMHQGEFDEHDQSIIGCLTGFGTGAEIRLSTLSDRYRIFGC